MHTLHIVRLSIMSLWMPIYSMSAHTFWVVNCIIFKPSEYSICFKDGLLMDISCKCYCKWYEWKLAHFSVNVTWWALWTRLPWSLAHCEHLMNALFDRQWHIEKAFPLCSKGRNQNNVWMAGLADLYGQSTRNIASLFSFCLFIKSDMSFQIILCRFCHFP